MSPTAVIILGVIMLALGYVITLPLGHFLWWDIANPFAGYSIYLYGLGGILLAYGVIKRAKVKV